MTEEAHAKKKKEKLVSEAAGVNVPLWSQDPAVNAVAVVLLRCFQTQLLTKESLPTTRREQSDQGQGTDRTVQLSGRASPASVTASSCCSSERAFASEPPPATATATATTLPVASAPTVLLTDSRPIRSSSEAHKQSKPTRRELVEALQLHLEILEKRGMVSSVIPSFFRSTKARGLMSEEKDQDHASSTCSTRAVRHGNKRPYAGISKYQYYQDLIVDMVPALPIPKEITFPTGIVQPTMTPLQSESEASLSLLFSEESTDASEWEESSNKKTRLAHS